MAQRGLALPHPSAQRGPCLRKRSVIIAAQLVLIAGLCLLYILATKGGSRGNVTAFSAARNNIRPGGKRVSTAMSAAQAAWQGLAGGRDSISASTATVQRTGVEGKAEQSAQAEEQPSLTSLPPQQAPSAEKEALQEEDGEEGRLDNEAIAAELTGSIGAAAAPPLLPGTESWANFDHGRKASMAFLLNAGRGRGAAMKKDLRRKRLSRHPALFPPAVGVGWQESVAEGDACEARWGTSWWSSVYSSRQDLCIPSQTEKQLLVGVQGEAGGSLASTAAAKQPQTLARAVAQGGDTAAAQWPRAVDGQYGVPYGESIGEAAEEGSEDSPKALPGSRITRWSTPSGGHFTWLRNVALDFSK